jgi:hypothetical protein
MIFNPQMHRRQKCAAVVCWFADRVLRRRKFELSNPATRCWIVPPKCLMGKFRLAG